MIELVLQYGVAAFIAYIFYRLFKYELRDLKNEIRFLRMDINTMNKILDNHLSDLNKKIEALVNELKLEEKK